jgi:hypothetical protein
MLSFLGVAICSALFILHQVALKLVPPAIKSHKLLHDFALIISEPPRRVPRLDKCHVPRQMISSNPPAMTKFKVTRTARMLILTLLPAPKVIGGVMVGLLVTTLEKESVFM